MRSHALWTTEQDEEVMIDNYVYKWRLEVRQVWCLHYNRHRDRKSPRISTHSDRTERSDGAVVFSLLLLTPSSPESCFYTVSHKKRGSLYLTATLANTSSVISREW